MLSRRIDPNTEIVTTCGSTGWAMMAAMMTVTVRAIKSSFLPVLRELPRGHHPVRRAESSIKRRQSRRDFHLMRTCLRTRSRQHPKAIIPCNPSNPCGKVFTREELEIIAPLAEKYDTYMSPTRCKKPSYSRRTSTPILLLPCRHTKRERITAVVLVASKTYCRRWRSLYHAPPEITGPCAHDFPRLSAAQQAPLQERRRYRSEVLLPHYYDDLQAGTHKARSVQRV